VITSMVRADGIVVVPMHTVIEEGAEVEVRLLD
jgi:molybdopterin biosynthesis enzyme